MGTGQVTCSGFMNLCFGSAAFLSSPIPQPTPALGEQVLCIFYVLSTEFDSRDSAHALARRGCDVNYLCAH